MLYVIIVGEILGLILWFFAAKNQSIIGLRSIAFLLYGYKTWTYSNRLGGMFLTALSTSYLLLYIFYRDHFTILFKVYIVLVLVLIVLFDLLTIKHYNQQKNQ